MCKTLIDPFYNYPGVQIIYDDLYGASGSTSTQDKEKIDFDKFKDILILKDIKIEKLNGQTCQIHERTTFDQSIKKNHQYLRNWKR